MKSFKELVESKKSRTDFKRLRAKIYDREMDKAPHISKNETTEEHFHEDNYKYHRKLYKKYENLKQTKGISQEDAEIYDYLAKKHKRWTDYHRELMGLGSEDDDK